MTSVDYITNFITNLNGEEEPPIDLGYVFQSSLPIGSIIMYGGGSGEPANWLLCNGNSLSTTGTYAKLFNVIGYTYGGSGSSFKIPNLQTKFPIGAANTTNLTVAVDGVNETYAGNATMNLNQMVNHSHTWASGYSGFVQWLGGDPGSNVKTGNNGLNMSFTQKLSTGNINSYDKQSELYPPFCAVNYIIKFN